MARRCFFAAALGLWLLFLVQAIHAPALLDDWFQLRYWRDHDLGATSLVTYAHHNYLHYNPRIGEVFLAIIDGSRAIHLILTPLVQLAALLFVFVLAFARWPRRTFADLQLLLFTQVMIWLVIPIPGIIYFYRPIATNYLWAFTVTLALFVPFRLGTAADKPRHWLAPIMLVVGWTAGMCNEHTGPTAMIAIAAFVIAAWHRKKLRAWMVTAMIGLYVGYPMLFFAPGQSVRYDGIATRDTPTKLLADRGITGCFDILVEFVHESRLGLVIFVAAIVRYVVTERASSAPSRETTLTAAALVAAAGSIVVTLFVSPITTDRVLYAPGVLLVAALAVVAQHLYSERSVRHLVTAACALLFAYHAVRFVTTYAAVKAENDERLALLAATPRGQIAVVPSYDHARRSRWHLGDDFELYPWLADYVAGELYDLSRVDLDRIALRPSVRYRGTSGPPALPVFDVPTYRQWQDDPLARLRVAARAGGARFTIEVLGLPFHDPRPIVAVEWTAAGVEFFDGRPHDDWDGHFIRVRDLPPRVESAYVVGCGNAQRVAVGPLLPVDEHVCRGPFTALACEPDRCWVAGWY